MRPSHNSHHYSHHHGRRFAYPERTNDPAAPNQDRRHRGHGRERASLGRFFVHGDLRLLVLTLVAEKPRHGYEIIKAIEDRVAGAYSPSPGVIYPSLTLLEELGYVTVAAADGGKKLHDITESGRAFLDLNQPTLAAILARMDDAVRAAGDAPAPQIHRASENLKLALRLRTARAPLADAQIASIAAALDAAALAIERV